MHDVHVIFKNHVTTSITKKIYKNNFYYSIFIDINFKNRFKKIHGSEYSTLRNGYIYMEKCIYVYKIKNMYEKRIAEFNYKLLNDILNNNVYVSKWNKRCITILNLL